MHGDLQAVDNAIKLLFKEGLLQTPAWDAAAADVRQIISSQLQPLLSQVKQAAASLHDQMTREQLAFGQLALQQLPRQLAQGAPATLLLTYTSAALAYACNNCSVYMHSAAAWCQGAAMTCPGLCYLLSSLELGLTTTIKLWLQHPPSSVCKFVAT